MNNFTVIHLSWITRRGVLTVGRGHYSPTSVRFRERKVGVESEGEILTFPTTPGMGEGVNFEVGGAKFAIFALTYNVQFWSYEHVVNMFLQHLGTLSERSEHQK